MISLYRRLLTQLESFKPGPKKATTPQSKDSAPGDSVRYELFYRPEQAQFSKNAKVSRYSFRYYNHDFVNFGRMLNFNLQRHVKISTTAFLHFYIVGKAVLKCTHNLLFEQKFEKYKKNTVSI